MKKIVAFSLFGTDLKYYVGAEKNIQLVEELLPSWEVSIYYHPDITSSIHIQHLSTLKCNLINVADICLNINKPIIDHPIPYFWRFFSFFDENISISRDLDSRISKREVEYINRWLNSDKDFFVIRDHPWHSQYPAGLFGIKGNKNNFKGFTEAFMNSKDMVWGDDQLILDLYMSSVPKTDIEYCGFDQPDTYIKRDNENFFIGIQLDENDNPTEMGGVVGLNHLKSMNL